MCVRESFFSIFLNGHEYMFYEGLIRSRLFSPFSKRKLGEIGGNWR